MRENVGRIIRENQLSKIRLYHYEINGAELDIRIQLEDPQDHLRLIQAPKSREWTITAIDNWQARRRSNSGQQSRRYKLFIGQVDKEASETDLLDYLSSSVDVVSVEIKQANFAFVIVDSHKEAMKCINEFDHRQFKSKRLTVDWASSRRAHQQTEQLGPVKEPEDKSWDNEEPSEPQEEQGRIKRRLLFNFFFFSNILGSGSEVAYGRRANNRWRGGRERSYRPESGPTKKLKPHTRSGDGMAIATVQLGAFRDLKGIHTFNIKQQQQAGKQANLEEK